MAKLLTRRNITAFRRHQLGEVVRVIQIFSMKLSSSRSDLLNDPPKLMYSFEEDFFFSAEKTDVLNVREGGYVDVSSKDLDEYFPEGLAG